MQRSLCNLVLHEKDHEHGEMYYVPAYLVIIVKRLESFNFGNSTLRMYMTLVLHVMWKGLPEGLRASLMRIKMRLNNEHIEFAEDACCEVKVVDQLLVFTKRTCQDVTFVSTLRKFPFDEQRVDLEFELTSNFDRKSKTRARFNFHIKNEWQEMLFMRGQIDAIPEYDIAYGSVPAPIVVADRNHLKNGTHTTPCFPKLTWTIPLYREPGYVLMSSFVPLFLLNVISLGVYVLDFDDTANRLSALITILLAMFAFLPSYRAQMPNISEFTVMDLNISLSVLIMLFEFVDTVVGKIIGDVVTLKTVLLVSSLVCATAVPVWVTYHFIQFKRTLHEKINGRKYALAENLREVKVVPKVTTSSSEGLLLEHWGIADFVKAAGGEFQKVEIVTEKNPSRVFRFPSDPEERYDVPNHANSNSQPSLFASSSSPAATHPEEENDDFPFRTLSTSSLFASSCLPLTQSVHPDLTRSTDSEFFGNPATDTHNNAILSSPPSVSSPLLSEDAPLASSEDTSLISRSLTTSNSQKKLN